MHILFITANPRYLDEASEQRALLSMINEVAESLHVVVLTTRSRGFKDRWQGPHMWIYPTNSFFAFRQYFDALSIIRSQVVWQNELRADIVLSDDATIAGWLGLHMASKYKRVWMVNLHDFYWDYKPSVSRLLRHAAAVPLSDIFKNAYRVIAFSERIAIYAQKATSDALQAKKVVVFPEIYAAPQVAENSDIKILHPEFNFIMLWYLPHHSDKLALVLETLAVLRRDYRKAGLVIMVNKKTHSMLAEVKHRHMEEWVRFEVIEPESLPFTNANVFLYLGEGEEEDTMLIRVAAAGLTPIVAGDSVVSQKIFSDNVNGLVLPTLDAQVIAATIRKLNETPGLRELLRVNAGLLLQQKVVPSREEVVAKLREYLTVEYAEADNAPERYLFEQITKKPSTRERVLKYLNSMKDYYTKMK